MSEKNEQKAVAWMRELEGDVSYLGNMIFASNEDEMDESQNLIPLYTNQQPDYRGACQMLFSLGYIWTGSKWYKPQDNKESE